MQLKIAVNFVMWWICMFCTSPEYSHRLCSCHLYPRQSKWTWNELYPYRNQKKCIKMTTLLWCLVKHFCMFRLTNAIIRELIWSSQATCMSVCISRRIVEFRVNYLRAVLLHVGYKWLWPTAVRSSWFNP
jgi:hypothetical protein